MVLLDVDLLVFVIPTFIAIAAVIFSSGIFYQKVKSMDASLKIINHNTSAMMKSLLRRGVLEPHDLEGL